MLIEFQIWVGKVGSKLVNSGCRNLTYSIFLHRFEHFHYQRWQLIRVKSRSKNFLIDLLKIGFLLVSWQTPEVFTRLKVIRGFDLLIHRVVWNDFLSISQNLNPHFDCGVYEGVSALAFSQGFDNRCAVLEPVFYFDQVVKGYVCKNWLITIVVSRFREQIKKFFIFLRNKILPNFHNGFLTPFVAGDDFVHSQC